MSVLTGSRLTANRFNVWLVGGGLALACVVLVLHAARLASSLGEGWQTGDWLINYSGGLVRRGLVGQLLLLVGDGPRMLWVLAGAQILFIVVIYGLGFLLFLGTDRSASWLMLTLSPAFMLFPAMQPVAGIRKELIGVAALVVMACVVRFRAHPMFACLAYAMFAVGAFSHEVTALLAPAFLFLVLAGGRAGALSRQHVRVATVALGIVSASAVLLAVMFPGDTGQGEQICQSVVDTGLSVSICSGSMDYLGTTLGTAMAAVAAEWPAYGVYALLGLLALVPLYLVGASKRLWMLVLCTYVLLVPVFATAVDYGRWIYLATAGASIATLATARLDGLRSRRVPELFAVVFVLGWGMNYYGAALIRGGVVSQVWAWLTQYA